jgi:hypothetical protein
MVNIKILIEEITEYKNRYNCSLAEAIADLEFDGPHGSSGPTAEELAAINNHFEGGSQDEFFTDPNYAEE